MKNMNTRKPADLVVRALEVEEFAMPGDEHVYLSQCLIDGESVGSTDLNVNRGTLKAGQKLKGGSHPVGSDECYFVLHGRARLALGGDPKTGEGAEIIDIEPETAIFIPGGTYHALDNPYDEDLVILTLWPRLPRPGDNGVYDARIEAWGTSFRKRAPAGAAEG
jgi:oxalate decarboxylase/phosphoglucose isomerase-like protein (cupin superfamily)